MGKLGRLASKELATASSGEPSLSFQQLLAKRLVELQTCLLAAHELEVERRLRARATEERHSGRIDDDLALPGALEEAESALSDILSDDSSSSKKSIPPPKASGHTTKPQGCFHDRNASKGSNDSDHAPSLRRQSGGVFEARDSSPSSPKTWMPSALKRSRSRFNSDGHAISSAEEFRGLERFGSEHRDTKLNSVGRERGNSKNSLPAKFHSEEGLEQVTVDAWSPREQAQGSGASTSVPSSAHPRPPDEVREHAAVVDAWSSSDPLQGRGSDSAEVPPRLHPEAPASPPSVLDGADLTGVQDWAEIQRRLAEDDRGDANQQTQRDAQEPTDVEEFVADLRELRFKARDEVHIVSRQNSDLTISKKTSLASSCIDGKGMEMQVIPDAPSKGFNAIEAFCTSETTDISTQSLCLEEGREILNQLSRAASHHHVDGTRSDFVGHLGSDGGSTNFKTLMSASSNKQENGNKPARRRSFSAIKNGAEALVKNNFKRRISFSGKSPSQPEPDAERPSLQRSDTKTSMVSAFVYEVDPAWRVEVSDAAGRRSSTIRLQRNTTQMFKDLQSLQTHMEMARRGGDVAARLRRFLNSFWLHPHSIFSVCWHMLSFFIIGWDVVFIPMQVFELPDTWWMPTMSWISRLYWTIDIFVSFITAFIKTDGELETSRWRIAKRYARTWLLLDLCIVTFEWLEVIIYDNAVKPHTLAKSLLFARGVQAVQASRLLRMARTANNFSEALSRLVFYARSEEVKILCGIAQIMLFVAVFIHCIACAWYGAGRAGDMTGSWLVVNHLAEESTSHQYAASFHWSMAQFTGTDSVAPQNYIERVVAILILFPAYVISAFLISSITSSMTRLQIISANTSKQLSILHRYLIEHGISTALASRVQRNTQHYMSEQRRYTPESSVELLSVLSKPLRVELDYEVHSPVMMAHPFFQFYSKKNPAGMRQLCHAAVSRLFLTKEDVLFSDGEMPSEPRMFFLIRGRLLYRRKGHTPFHLSAGQWACEPVLWLSAWAHHGGMSAAIECNLLCLNAEEFRKITKQFIMGPIFYCGLYAMEFVKAVNEIKDAAVSEVFDQNGINVVDLVERVSEAEARASQSSRKLSLK